MTARIVLRVPIRFALQDGTSTHAPTVLAAVGAIHTRLVLDTGSDVHLLTREVAEAAGLGLGRPHTGTDHAGAQVQSSLLGRVPVTFTEATAGSPLDLEDVVAIPAPRAFLAGGIGGILSPQRLAPFGYGVLDERLDELLLLDGGAAAVEPELLRRHPTPAVLALPREPDVDVPIVQAAIEPHPGVPFLVNSGSGDTEVDPARITLAAVQDLRVIGRGVSGSPIQGASAGPQVLRVAGQRIRLPSVLLRPAMGEPPAMLGQDVLRGTVLAVAGDAREPVLWQVDTLAEAGDVDPEAASRASRGV